MVRKIRTPLSIPTSREDANRQIAEIGELSRGLRARELLFEEEVAKLRESVDRDVEVFTKKLTELTLGIEAYATANRAELTEGEGKTITFGAGVLGWRMTPTRVVIAKKKSKEVLKYLKARMKRFVRTTYAIDKEQLLKERPIVAGVSYEQEEQFFIEPHPPAPAEAESSALRIAS